MSIAAGMYTIYKEGKGNGARTVFLTPARLSAIILVVIFL